MIKLENGEAIKPIFKENEVTVCFSANNSYVSQTAVMIKSIIENASDTSNYDFIILSTDINQTNEDILTSFTEGKSNISIRIFDISSMLDNVSFYTVGVYTPTTYSKEAYFRLFIPFAMPDYQKVIYFDGDMVAISDVAPLMNIDLTDKIAAATRDYCGIAACYDPGSDRMSYRKEIGIKDIDSYFISSLVVVNIQEFRKHYSLDSLKELISSREWRQHDQDIFNILCQDQLIIIDAKWSFFEEFAYSMQWLPEPLKEELIQARENALVLHYASTNKAWSDENSKFTSYFWKYARQTPYFEDFFNRINPSSTAYRYHVMKNVLGEEINYYYDNDDIMLSVTPHKIGSVGSARLVVEFFKIKNHEVTIEGWFDALDFLGTLRVFAKLNGVGCITENGESYRSYANTSDVKQIRPFKITIPLDTSKNENYIDFGFTFDDKHFIRPHYVAVEQFAPINEHSYSFYSNNGYILTKQHGDCFKIEKHSRKKVFKYNKQLCGFLIRKKEAYFTKMSIMRWAYYYTKPFMRKKNVWLICDNNETVGDSTIRFYDYVKAQNDVTPYFVVTEQCKNISELKKHGKVLLARTKKHKLLFFHSKAVIASEYYMPFFLPAYDRANEVRDIFANKSFIYWDKNAEDFSENVRPWHNVTKFILDSEEKYDFMLTTDNGYTKDNLFLTDKLEGDKLYQAMFNEIKSSY